MNIGYLINTHANYTRPLNELLATMPLNLLEQVVIVSGGNAAAAGLTRWQRYLDLPLLEVEHDSWDYTGMIELVMMPAAPAFQRFTHFFCLQDTMLFGSRTHELVSAADPEKWATAAFGGQCNLALYRKDYLLAMRDYILMRRNNSKAESILCEGALWKMCAQNLSCRHEATFPPGTHAVVGSGRPYNSAVERIKEYYAGVDIVKWKANYGQNMNNLITQP